MNDWRYDRSNRHDVVTIPLVWFAFALSLLVHVLAVVIGWCVVRSIAAPVLFGQVFQLVPPVMLITMLPISIAGWGVRESALMLSCPDFQLVEKTGIHVTDD